MTGSLGMVASTLPVQWLLPLVGWRGLFWALAVVLALAIAALIAWVVPRDAPARRAARADRGAAGYRAVFRHPTFVRFAPIGFFHYGGMIAVQSLWAGPWLVEVSGWTPAAGGARPVLHQRRDAVRLHGLGRRRAAAVCARLDGAAA